MSRFMVIAAIAISYYVFAILLNSVGTVILQSINSFDISKPEASTLEGFKDLSIAVVSFLVASFIPRVGYKLSMLLGLALVAVACTLTPSIASFWFIKVLAPYCVENKSSHDRTCGSPKSRKYHN